MANCVRFGSSGKRPSNMAVDRPLKTGADSERQLDMMDGMAGERAGLGTGLAKFLVCLPQGRLCVCDVAGLTRQVVFRLRAHEPVLIDGAQEETAEGPSR